MTLPTVAVNVLTEADPIDVACLVDVVTIRHGRAGTTGQPEASTATLNLSWDATEGDLPPELEIGAGLEVVFLPPATPQTTRFFGRVTDIAVGWDEAGVDTPNRPAAQVIAAGPLADLGRRVLADFGLVADLDGPRVHTIVTDAGLPIVADLGTVLLLKVPRIETANPLELAQTVAEWADGLLWQRADGQIRYADANHRHEMSPNVILDACDVLVTPTWLRNTAGLVNHVALTYGVAPEGGQRPVYEATDTDSQDRYGVADQARTADLARHMDAVATVERALAHDSRPTWSLDELPLDVTRLGETDLLEVLGLDVNFLIELAGLPSARGTPVNPLLWVEGWTETLTFTTWELTLNVSDFCRTSPPPWWDDTPAWITWDDLDSAEGPPPVTWDEILCLSGTYWPDPPPPMTATELEGATHG